MGMWTWSFFLIVKIIIANWLPWAPKHLCETFAPLFPNIGNSLLRLVMTDLTLLFEDEKKLRISIFTEAIFLSTIAVHPLPPTKLTLSPRKSCDELTTESVDVEDIENGEVLEQLLLQWINTLSVSLLISLTVTCHFSRISSHWFYTLKTFSLRKLKVISTEPTINTRYSKVNVGSR